MSRRFYLTYFGCGAIGGFVAVALAMGLAWKLPPISTSVVLAAIVAQMLAIIGTLGGMTVGHCLAVREYDSPNSP